MDLRIEPAGGFRGGYLEPRDVFRAGSLSSELREGSDATDLQPYEGTSPEKQVLYDSGFGEAQLATAFGACSGDTKCDLLNRK